MARTCAACGRANEDDASFCQGCGAALAGPPRRGKPAPRWLVALIAIAAIALASVLVFVLYPRGDTGSGDQQAATPTTGATVGVSPSPSLDQYLAGAVGPKADRLAAIMADGTVKPITRFSGQQLWQIAYSPDGKWLACVAGTFKHSELWLLSTSTGDARQATAATPDIVAVDSIAWLADDQLLVAGYTESPKATGQNAEFLVYDVVGQSFSPLVDAGGVSLRGVSVSASHDGAKVAFVTYSDHKTNRYGLVTAKERLDGARPGLGHGDGARDQHGRLRRQRPGLRRTAHLAQGPGDHLPPGRQRRRHQLHGDRHRRDHPDAGQGGSHAGRLRVGPRGHQGRLHRPAGLRGKRQLAGGLLAVRHRSRRGRSRDRAVQGHQRPGPLVVTGRRDRSPGPSTTASWTGAPATSS